MKRSVIYSFLTLFFIGLGVRYIVTSGVQRYLTSELPKIVNKETLQIIEPQVSFPTLLRFKAIQASAVILPPVALPISCVDGELALRILPFLWGEIAFSGEMKCYSGDVRLKLSRGFFSSNLDFSIFIEGINLANHPVVGLTGTNGILSSIFNGKIMPDKQGIDATLSLIVNNLSLKHTALSSTFLKLVPEFSEGKLMLEVKNAAFVGSINKFEFTSSLGSAIGEGNYRFNQSFQPERFWSQTVIQLSEIGVGSVAPYLRLAIANSANNQEQQEQVGNADEEQFLVIGKLEKNQFNKSYIDWKIEPMDNEKQQ
jgi:hypothetical protein